MELSSSPDVNPFVNSGHPHFLRGGKLDRDGDRERTLPVGELLQLLAEGRRHNRMLEQTSPKLVQVDVGIDFISRDPSLDEFERGHEA